MYPVGDSHFSFCLFEIKAPRSDCPLLFSLCSAAVRGGNYSFTRARPRGTAQREGARSDIIRLEAISLTSRTCTLSHGQSECNGGVWDVPRSYF